MARSFTVLHAADIHGKLRPHPELLFRRGDGSDDRLVQSAGLAGIATLVRSARAERPEAILVNVGDLFHTSGIATRTAGAGMVAPLNALGADAYCPGNWDFAVAPPDDRRSIDVLLGLSASLAATTVAYNAWSDPPAEDGQPYFRPSLLLERGGVRMGIIGLTSVKVGTEMAPAFSRGVRFELLDSAPKRIGALAADLRASGADVVFLLSESGLEQDLKLATLLNGAVDVIFGAETHERTFTPMTVGKTLVLQAGAEASFLGRLDGEISEDGGIEWRWELAEVSDVSPDPEVAALIDDAYRAHPDLSEVVGSTSRTIMRNAVIETTADQLIADAIREAADSDIALSRGYRYGHPILSGPVTRDDLIGLLPVDPPLRIGMVRTEQLVERWEATFERVFSADPFRRGGGWLDRPSGMRVTFAARERPGARLLELAVGDRLVYTRDRGVRERGPWTVAGAAPEGAGPDALCCLGSVEGARTTSRRLQGIVERYVAAHSPLAVSLDGRVRAIDVPAVLRSQYAAVPLDLG